jgi:Xaa-Pro aminopeptidase
MDFQDGIAAIRRQMQEQGIDLLLGFHDGAHFIEKPNAVMVLSGFKSIGHALIILSREEESALIVTPSWDAARAAECSMSINAIGADDVVNALADYLSRHRVSPSAVGTAGLASMPWAIEERVTVLLHGEGRAADKMVFGAFRKKTADQIAKARRAAQIAERG